MTDMGHMDHLEDVQARDLEVLRRKELSYRGSWKRRGGVGAFFVFSRCWDRLEGALEAPCDYDIFEAIMADPSGQDGSVLASLRDLRRYLLLVEAEMVAQGVVSAQDGAGAAEDSRQRAQDLTVALDSEEHIAREAEERCGAYAELVLDILPVLRSSIERAEEEGHARATELRGILRRAENLVVPEKSRGR